MAQHRAAVICKTAKTAVLPRFYGKERGAGVGWQHLCGGLARLKCMVVALALLIVVRCTFRIRRNQGENCHCYQQSSVVSKLYLRCSSTSHIVGNSDCMRLIANSHIFISNQVGTLCGLIGNQNKIILFYMHFKNS